MNSATRNKTTLEHLHRAVERHGLTAQLEFFAEHSLNHGLPTTKADLRAVLADIERTFPDISFTPQEVVAEGDTVMVRYTVEGTHKGVQQHPFVHGGVLAGLPPSGKHFRVQHIHLFRFERGEIVAHDAVQDNLGLARQLGVPLAHTEKDDYARAYKTL